MERERHGHGVVLRTVMARRAPRACGARRRGTARSTSRRTASRNASLRGEIGAEHAREIEKAVGDLRRIAARRRGDRRERRRQRIGDVDRRARARRCRSRSGSSRRPRARDARSSAPAASRSRTVPSRRCGSFCEPSIAICCVRCGSAGLRKRSQQLRAVGGEIDARRRGERRHDLLAPSCRSISVASSGSRDACQMNSCPARKPRYASVEWLPLSRRSFIVSNGATSATNCAPASSQRGRGAGEAILDHPLAERLGDDRRRVVHAEQPRRLGDVGVGRRRHDAVDHRATETSTLRADPLRERRIDGAARTRARALDHAPVVRQVVAADDGERRPRPPRAARRVPRPARRSPITGASGCARSCTMSGCATVERAGRRVVAIALLGDGQRHDRDARIGEARDAARRARRRANSISRTRADHARATCRRALRAAPCRGRPAARAARSRAAS